MRESERERWKGLFDRYAYQTRHGTELGAARVLDEALAWLPVAAPPDDPARPHIVAGRFQSDKYAWCAPGFVPLKTSDRMAQPDLASYARKRRAEDAAFADDLEFALRADGYEPESVADEEALRALVDDVLAGRVNKSDRTETELALAALAQGLLRLLPAHKRSSP